MSMRVTIDGIQFRVTDRGSGNVILLLHGFPDSAQLWKDQVCRDIALSLISAFGSKARSARAPGRYNTRLLPQSMLPCLWHTLLLAADTCACRVRIQDIGS